MIGVVVAATGWAGVGEWLRNEFLIVVMICSGAYLATRIVSMLARRQIRRLAKVRDDHGSLSATTVGAHEGALVGALRWAINFSIVTVAVVWVMIELNLPASAVVPLASVLGAGLGFGAQQIVGDVLAGIFILSERQFGIGDLIRVGPLGNPQLVEGRVEEMTLRVTKLRTSDGDLVSVANGELRQSTNASRDWARMLLLVPLARHADLDAATTRLNALGAAMAAEDEWAGVLIEAPEVAGVEDLGADTIEVRFTGKTLPAQQYRVAREIRRRIAVELHDTIGPVRDTSDS
ncbi:MAG TPA: mechanosensitive ion channel family protein [Ilumatobacteraceae bacterium]